MKDLQLISRTLFGRTFFCLLLAAFIMSCEKEEIETSNLEVANASLKARNLVKVTSTGLNFDAPDEILSGWNTFMYMNKSGGTHFLMLLKIPDDISLDDYAVGVSEPFQHGMDYYREGDFLRAFSTQQELDELFPGEGMIAKGFGAVAEWYGNVIIQGGTGLISPGETATTSVYLEPGSYLLECYVKSPDGTFHSYNKRMIKEITVVEEEHRKSPEFQADISLELSSTSGINMSERRLSPGNKTFEVNFSDQSVYGNLLQHDVHLVRFENGFNPGDKEILNYWINYFYVNFDGQGPIPEGLMNPAPSGITFLGGAQEIPAGNISYFNATLTPGDYALISEIDDPMRLNRDTAHTVFYHEFTVE